MWTDASGRIEVDFNLARDIPLKADSVARSRAWARWAKYVELTTGTRRAAMLAPGSVVRPNR
jgi:hypothetical protein